MFFFCTIHFLLVNLLKINGGECNMGIKKLASETEAKEFFKKHDIQSIGFYHSKDIFSGRFDIEYQPGSRAYVRAGLGTRFYVLKSLSDALSELDLTDKTTENLFLNTPYDDLITYRPTGEKLSLQVDMKVWPELKRLINDTIKNDTKAFAKGDVEKPNMMNRPSAFFSSKEKEQDKKEKPGIDNLAAACSK